MAATYKDAGVDLEVYEQSMKRLPSLMARTQSPRVMPLAGGFAGLFQLNADGKSYDDPILVSGTDGVGTKLKVAIQAGKFDTVGIDLVAMCVNDCLCLGAEPLFFLDYLAMGKDDPNMVEQLVQGVSEGCVQARASLIGGETAIMPDLYAEGDFDMAGFCVGVVERTQLLDGSNINTGDVILGIPSSGLHSNGFSLVRKIVFEHAGLSTDAYVDELGTIVGEALLTPTRIYADVVSSLMSEQSRSSVTGIAHITGGGLEENLSRILPDGLRVEIEHDSWQVPSVFSWLQRLGDVDTGEMRRVFNMGIGLAVVTRSDAAEETAEAIRELNTECQTIGRIA